MKRLLKSLIAALVVCAGVFAANADASGPIKFRVQIKASQTTDWKQPYFETAGNCFNRPWRQGEGGEVVKFNGSGIAYAQKVGRNFYSTYGSPDFGPGGKHGIALKAKNERRSYSAQGNKPGPCGGGTPDEVQQVQCGVRAGSAWGQLSWDTGGKRLRVRAPLADGTDLGFPDCGIWAPEGVQQAGLTEITQKAPARELLDPNFKKHIVIARRTYTGKLYPDAATITEATHVYWQVTLTRLSH
jgi:hypothetical protein